MYTVEMASRGMIHLPNFMEIAAGVHPILRFFHSSLKVVMLILLLGDFLNIIFAIRMGPGGMYLAPLVIRSGI
jgi:hypothetical protein